MQLRKGAAKPRVAAQHRRPLHLKPSFAVGMAPSTTDVKDISADVRQELNAKYAELKRNTKTWQVLPIPEKIAILKEIQDRLLHKTVSWGRAGAAVRGLLHDPVGVASETLNTSLTAAYYIPGLIHTLEALHATGKAPEVPKLRTAPDGREVYKVWPVTPNDQRIKFIAAGVEAELYVQPGKPSSQAGVYIGDGVNQDKGGRVCAVLGAGNHGFLGLKDVLYCLFECNNVALFKPHPLQAQWHEFADYVLEPLSRRGFYRSFYSHSIEETRAMLYHPDCGCVHMTGGIATHDAIVWGSGKEEQARRKAANDPLLKVPITSELGCISPWIVSPGKWTDEQIEAQAANAVQGIHYNNSCNCNALKVLVLPQGWEQADQFLDKVKEILRKVPSLPPWYPGIQERYAAWQAVFPDAEVVEGGPAVAASQEFPGHVQPTLIQELPYPEPGAPLSEQQQYAFTVEPFAPTLVVVRIPCPDVPRYFQAATDFANDRLWGDLSCTVIMHPDVEAEHPEATQKMLDDLRYGAVVVNAWSAMSYALAGAVWGAYAGDQTLANVGSGLGQIGNSHLFDHPQKCVVKGPMVGSWVPKPLYLTPLPLPVVKALVGYLVKGWAGIWQSVVGMK